MTMYNNIVKFHELWVGGKTVYDKSITKIIQVVFYSLTTPTPLPFMFFFYF